MSKVDDFCRSMTTFTCAKLAQGLRKSVPTEDKGENF